MNARTARIIRMRRKRRQGKQGDASTIVRGAIALLTLNITLVVVGLLGVVGFIVGTYVYYARELPPPAQIEQVQSEAFKTTILYDRTGQQVLYEIIAPNDGDRQNVSIHDLPEYVLQATVAIEDSSFYTNPGFNPRGIARAIFANATGGTVQGGSSITQQLVKNVLLTEEERTLSVDRKIKELILASEISRLYSKDQILEWYLNTNNYGSVAYGIEAAARLYFNKSARDLTLPEAAMLAAIPQFPHQNPISNPEAAQLRQELVLRRMANLGYITQAEADAALAEPLEIQPYGERFEIVAPHFSFYARDEAIRLLNQMGLDGDYLVSRGGLRIYTTLDVDLQQQMECVSRSHVARLDGGSPDFVQLTDAGTPCTAANYLPPVEPDLLGTDRRVSNAAGLVLRAETAEIMAMSGSVDFWNQEIDGNFNVVTAQRQPGSTFKPVVYMTAFLYPLNGAEPVTSATMTTDVALEFTDIGSQPYIPRNIDNLYHGPVSLRQALGNSYNVPVVQVLNWIGLSKVINIAHRLGINSLSDSSNAYGLSMALGAEEVSLLDMTYVYNVFNAQGYWVGTPVHVSQAREGYRQLDPVSILRIEDASGAPLWEYSEAQGTFDRRYIIPSGMAYIMTDMLADPQARLPSFPAGNPMELSRPAAVKTGTTDDNRDSWTIGYTPQYTTGIWVGNNNNDSMTDITGINGAAPIWHAVMEYLHTRDNEPVRDWERPNTVVEQTVCKWSGLLPTQNCQQVPNELFYVDIAQGVDYRPQRLDDMWYTLQINKCNNTRANDDTPPTCLRESVFFDFRTEEMIAWAKEYRPELLPPEEEDTVVGSSLFGPVALTSPRFTDRIGGTVPVMGSIIVEDVAYYQVDYGQGSDPTTFVNLGGRVTEIPPDNQLATWDTSALEDGLYTLRLQVVYTDNRTESVRVQVTVDNTAPEIRLVEPQPARTYTASDDVFITLAAEVFDAGGVQSVAFYTLDESGEPAPLLIEESTAAPYVARWTIEGEGLRTFWAVVTDQAGNETESERVIINVQD